jgi:hypothetical protein
MASSKAKSLELARLSIEQFFHRNFGNTYFWTFSEPGRKEGELLWTKDEAEAHFKPFRDLCARRGFELLVVWERQERGAWHPHCLLNHFVDVNRLRPWMMVRGWGQQMKVVRVMGSCKGNSYPPIPGRGRGQWVLSGESAGLARYLTKYLTKGFRDDPATASGPCRKKKMFSGSRAVKMGNTKFKWMPEIKAGAYLWHHGRALFFQIFDRHPYWKEMGFVIRLGVETTGWADIDPLWEFGFRT